MVVCLQKDAKQCCDAPKFGCSRCAGQRRMSSTRIMRKTKLCGITALFGVFLETHINISRDLAIWIHTNIKISRDLGSKLVIELCWSKIKALLPYTSLARQVQTCFSKPPKLVVCNNKRLLRNCNHFNYSQVNHILYIVYVVTTCTRE